MVRIPTTLVALALGLALDAGTCALVLVFAPLAGAPIVLLPMWAAAGGYVAARWSVRSAPAPGLAVGVLLVAFQVGAAFGPYPALLPLISPPVLLLQLIAALSGGLAGAVKARRAEQAAPRAPRLTPFS